MTKKKRTPNPLPTDPRKRYVALANRRVNVAINAIKSIGKLASKANQYDQTDVNAVQTVIMDATSTAIVKLETQLRGGDDEPSIAGFDAVEARENVPDDAED